MLSPIKNSIPGFNLIEYQDTLTGISDNGVADTDDRRNPVQFSFLYKPTDFETRTITSLAPQQIFSQTNPLTIFTVEKYRYNFIHTIICVKNLSTFQYQSSFNIGVPTRLIEGYFVFTDIGVFSLGDSDNLGIVGANSFTNWTAPDISPPESSLIQTPGITGGKYDFVTTTQNPSIAASNALVPKVNSDGDIDFTLGEIYEDDEIKGLVTLV